jgi:hypothetical protein
MHVYIEHDGVPWLDRTHVSPDPIVHNPLMLRLMALDAVSAIYSRRPCYDGLATAPNCSFTYWTRARYSEAVVTTQAGLRKILTHTHAPGYVLDTAVAARCSVRPKVSRNARW